MKELLIETTWLNPLKPPTLLESNDQQSMLVDTLLTTCDVKNENERIYGFEMFKEKAEKYNQAFVINGNAYGELDHPESTVVELKNACHTIEKMWWEEKQLFGTLDILGGPRFPSGNIVWGLLERGKRVGISSRCVGSVIDVNGALMVQDDLEIIGWDIVGNPSNHGSFLNKHTGQQNENIVLASTNILTNETKINQHFYNIFCEYAGNCKLEY